MSPTPGRPQDDLPNGSWQSWWPEIAVTATALAACCTAAFILGGTRAFVLVMVVFTAIAFVVVSRLLPPSAGAPEVPQVPSDRTSSTSSFGTYWRLLARLNNGTASMSAYQADLGPRLEHLLAARLSEHHGINLYKEPQLARDMLCAKPRDSDLWQWVDPNRSDDRSAKNADGAPGIPSRALARLVRRIEQI